MPVKLKGILESRIGRKLYGGTEMLVILSFVGGCLVLFASRCNKIRSAGLDSPAPF